MSRTCIDITMKLLSDAIFGAGYSIPGGEDISVRTDSNGAPYFAGPTLKGLFRESLCDWLSWTAGDANIVTMLLGESGYRSDNDSRRLVFGDLRMKQPQEQWEGTRTFTRLKDGIVETGTLRSASCLRSGLCFAGCIFCDSEDEELIRTCLSAIKWVGLMRHRGFGHVAIQGKAAAVTPSLPPAAETHCLHYRLKLENNMVVTRYNRGQLTGEAQNHTDTHTFLHGSAVRGLICSALAQQSPEWFEENKTKLLGDTVRFSNALPSQFDLPSIPTPMGFYEEKNGKDFHSILIGDAKAGQKRAKLGSYCCIKNGKELYTATPLTTNSIRNQRRDEQGEKQMFTSRVLEHGTILEGYITIEDASLAPSIASAFQEWVSLGANHYAGNGLCHVEVLEAVEEPAWRCYGYQVGDTVPEELFLLLLSPTSMQRNGVPVGLDEQQLADLLGVEAVSLVRCSTAVSAAGGFNRTWGCNIPAATFYESGSVFRIRCSTAPSVEAIQNLEYQGLGIRRSEGYGQILFLKTDMNLEKAERPEENTDEVSDAVAERQARCEWLLDNVDYIPRGLSSQQLGNIQTLCEQAIAMHGDCSKLDEFFVHNMEERGAHHGAKFVGFREFYEDVMSCSIAETLGTAVKTDSIEEKLRLLCDLLDLSRKGEKR